MANGTHSPACRSQETLDVKRNLLSDLDLAEIAVLLVVRSRGEVQDVVGPDP